MCMFYTCFILRSSIHCSCLQNKQHSAGLNEDASWRDDDTLGSESHFNTHFPYGKKKSHTCHVINVITYEEMKVQFNMWCM